MQSLVALAIIAAFFLVVGGLAYAGIRKARSMSRDHVSQLRQSGEEARLARPKTGEDYFLRPMSTKDVVVSVVGGSIFVASTFALKSWLGW